MGGQARKNLLGGAERCYNEYLLTLELGPGYTEKGVRRMIQFAERFPEGEIVEALSRECSWSHFLELILDIRLRVVTDLCVPGVAVAPLP